jgi:hypothetical protein
MRGSPQSSVPFVVSVGYFRTNSMAPRRHIRSAASLRGSVSRPQNARSVATPHPLDACLRPSATSKAGREGSWPAAGNTPPSLAQVKSIGAQVTCDGRLCSRVSTCRRFCGCVAALSTSATPRVPNRSANRSAIQSGLRTLSSGSRPTKVREAARIEVREGIGFKGCTLSSPGHYRFRLEGMRGSECAMNHRRLDEPLSVVDFTTWLRCRVLEKGSCGPSPMWHFQSRFYLSLMDKSSTSKMSVAFGPTGPPAPRSP